MRVVECVDLGISSLRINVSSVIVDSKPVGSKEAQQLSIDNVDNDRSRRVEVQNTRDEAVGFDMSTDEEGLKDFSEVAVTTVGARWRERIVWGDESLGLPGGNDMLLHGIICDGDQLRFRSKGDLKLIDGEENLSGRVRHNIIRDERSLSTPNSGLVQDIST